MKTINLYLRDWILSTGKSDYIGLDAENKSENLVIECDTIDDTTTYYIDIGGLDDEKNYAEMEKDTENKTMSIVLTSSMLCGSGKKYVQVRGTRTDGTVIKSNTVIVKVGYSVNATDQYTDPLPSAFDQYETKIKGYVADAEAASKKIPTVKVERTAADDGADITVTDGTGTTTKTTITDGKDGADGKTPVRGTDYWTDVDKTEMQTYMETQITAQKYASQADIDSLNTFRSKYEMKYVGVGKSVQTARRDIGYLQLNSTVSRIISDGTTTSETAYIKIPFTNIYDTGAAYSCGPVYIMFYYSGLQYFIAYTVSNVLVNGAYVQQIVINNAFVPTSVTTLIINNIGFIYEPTTALIAAAKSEAITTAEAYTDAAIAALGNADTTSYGTVTTS